MRKIPPETLKMVIVAGPISSKPLAISNQPKNIIKQIAMMIDKTLSFELNTSLLSIVKRLYIILEHCTFSINGTFYNF